MINEGVCFTLYNINGPTLHVIILSLWYRGEVVTSHVDMTANYFGFQQTVVLQIWQKTKWHICFSYIWSHSETKRYSILFVSVQNDCWDSEILHDGNEASQFSFRLVTLNVTWTSAADRLVQRLKTLYPPHIYVQSFQVLCWGVRNMKKFQMVKVTSPVIEFECMGAIIPSQTIENTKKTPNFAEPILERKILVGDDQYSRYLYLSAALETIFSLSDRHKIFNTY